MQPFLDSSVELVDNPFVTWYRAASARVRPMRCVFEDTATIHAPLRALQFGHLDANSFGPYHRDGSIVIEPDTDHFDLIRPYLVLRHMEELMLALREGRGSTGQGPVAPPR